MRDKSQDPWRNLHKRAVGVLERPVADHLKDSGEPGPAAAAYRTAQASGRIADVRQQAHSLKGGAPPRHDSDRHADAWNDSPPAHSEHSGTGNASPLHQQDPPLWPGKPGNEVRAGSPYAASLIAHVHRAVADRRRARRGR